MQCPVCGGELMVIRGITIKEGYLICDRGSIRLSAVMLTIMNALLRGPTGVDALVELVYSNFDMSPKSPRNCVQVQICRLRPRLAPLGWDITSTGPGYSGLGPIYKLERATA